MIYQCERCGQWFQRLNRHTPTCDGRRHKPKVKAPKHRGHYPQDSRRLLTASRANPDTTCWRCGLTLDRHQPHKNGRPAYWTCGHVDDHNAYIPHPLATYIDGQLCAPEASTCNYRAAGELGNLATHGPRTRQRW